MYGMDACNIGPKSDQPRPVSPNPCRMMTVAVCLVLLGKEIGLGYCQAWVCIDCTDWWECLGVEACFLLLIEIDVPFP